MNCPQCGALLPDGAKFCTNCGSKVTDSSAVSALNEVLLTPENETAAVPEAAAPEISEPETPISDASEPEAPVFEAPEPETAAPQTEYSYRSDYQENNYQVQDQQNACQNQYQQNVYQANAYQQAQYQQPQGGYQQNAYQANAYQANAYQQPQYQQNPYQAQNPYPQNAYQANGYQSNGYQQAQYQQAQGGYQQNAYQANAYQQPQYQQAQYQQNGYQANGYPGYSQAAKKPAKKKTGLIIGIVAGVVVLAAIIIAVVLLNKKDGKTSTVNLNDYVTVDVAGYNGDGTLYAYLDYDALEADYGDKLTWTTREDPGCTVVDMIYENVYVYADSSYGLSNGDEVQIEFDDTFTYIVEAFPELYDTKTELTYEAFTYTVSGLEDRSWETGYLTDYTAIYNDSDFLDDVYTAVFDWLSSDNVFGTDYEYGVALDNIGFYDLSYWYSADGNAHWDTNVLYVIYEVDLLDEAGNTYIYYYFARYSDLYVNDDGTITFYEGDFADFSDGIYDYDASDRTFPEFELTLDDGDTITVTGAESPDELIEMIYSVQSTDFIQ